MKSARTRPCSLADARARLVDAEAFLAAAELLDDPDVVTTNAVMAAIAASDVICCVALGERAADRDHVVASDVLARVDPKLGRALVRILDHKKQAAYEVRDIGAADVRTVLRLARTLVEEARRRLIAS
jgi:hypothetical protein